MKRKLLLLLMLVPFFTAYGQFNKSAPWMKELEKSKDRITTSRQGVTKKAVYTFDEITNAFDDYWIGKDKDAKGSGYKPFMRWRNYWQHFVKDDGTLPTANELWTTWENFKNAAGPVNPTSNWTPLGPVVSGEINNGFALPGIGRVNAIAVDPNDENTWYAGAPAGGIWKTTDGGSTWDTLFDEFPQIGVSGIAIDPNNSSIVYIATGDDDASDSFSAGVFKSVDGGANWQETGLSPDTQNEFDTMNEIVISPASSDIIWVGTTDGLQRSDDAGDTWDIKLAGNITDFKLKPGDPNTIYAVSANQFFKSTDGGENFTQITDVLPTTGGRMVLGVSAAAPDMLYICVADTIGRDSEFLGLFKSTNSGTSFTQTQESDDIFGSTQAWFDFALEVSPTNPNELYVGVLDVWKSTDGGDDFTQLNSWNSNTPAYTHADIHTLKFFGSRLFCGSDGGLFASDDEGATFTDYSDGLAITQFYRIGIAKNDASKIVGGTQDNSGFVYNNSEWNVYTGGDGMDYEVDPTNSNIAYGFVQFGNFLFITNNLGQSIDFIGAPSANGATLSGNWITPLAIDNEGTVYSAFNAVYRLDGNAWTRVSDIITGDNIDDLEIDPNNKMVMYLAVGDRLYRSEDGGVDFDFIDIEFSADISDIAINNNDGNVVYITTSRRVGTPQGQQPATRSVHRVTMDGNTLVSEENITFDLPTDQAYFAIVHQPRDNSNPIFVATSLGVYRLDDTLTEWEQYSTNLPNTAFSDLEISPDDEVLVASTYGRGVWQSPIPIQVPNNDVKFVSITPNSALVECNEIMPEVVVENKGLNPITQVEVTFSIDDGPSENLTFTETIASGATASIPLSSATITDIGPTSITANVFVANDAFEDNNSGTATFIPNQFANGDQLFDFENETSSLVTYNEGFSGSVWERGVPTGTLLNTASSGTQVLGTNLDGNHPDQTKGYILSGCYEMANILNPVLKFNMAYDLEVNFDIVYVEYSLDDGQSWTLLGTVDSQPNWYNSDRTLDDTIDLPIAQQDCQNCPGGQWNGTNTDLTEYSYDFTANAALGETDLTVVEEALFRIVFHSDPLTNEEGVIVDDFRVEGFQDDEDDDNDGVLDVDDNCPLSANANQLDTDGDGEGDACDMDDDNDGILDVDDNCPLIANADQADGDGDNIGDVCDDDLDNDGVPNAIDLCPDTPANAVVDVDGCTIFSLPANNFALKTTGESCASNDNGSIELTATESLNYIASLTDDSANVAEIQFSDVANFTNLIAGDYTLCVTVDGQAGFEQCFDITITEPEALDVGSKISTLANEVTLELSGGNTYFIDLNGERFTTTNSEITLPLNKVENVLSVRTDKDCQGSYDETIVLSSQIFVYPNPVSDGTLNVYLGTNEFNIVRVALFDVNGKQVVNKSVRPDNGYLRMGVTGMPEGIYLLNIKTERTLLNFKILKK